MRPVLVVKLPTARQTLAVGQETPDREDETAFLGLWVGWTIQFVPFQRSASASWVPGSPPKPLPTAMHSVADGQDTLFRLPFGTVPAAWAGPATAKAKPPVAVAIAILPSKVDGRLGPWGPRNARSPRIIAPQFLVKSS